MRCIIPSPFIREKLDPWFFKYQYMYFLKCYDKWKVLCNRYIRTFAKMNFKVIPLFDFTLNIYYDFYVVNNSNIRPLVKNHLELYHEYNKSIATKVPDEHELDWYWATISN